MEQSFATTIRHVMSLEPVLREFAVSMRYCATYTNLLMVYAVVRHPASCQAARLPTVGSPRQFVDEF